jgi:hypothetical protein
MNMKKKQIKALFIDVVNQSITEISIIPKFEHYYPLLDCRTIEAIYLENDTDVIYLDEEGLLTKKDGYFALQGYQQIFAGNGLAVGTLATYDGNEDDNVKISLEELKAQITFFRPDEIDPDDIEPMMVFVPFIS